MESENTMNALERRRTITKAITEHMRHNNEMFIECIIGQPELYMTVQSIAIAALTLHRDPFTTIFQFTTRQYEGHTLTGFSIIIKSNGKESIELEPQPQKTMINAIMELEI